MAITALPTPPSRQDPTNFNDRADAFLGALPLFQTEANALQVNVNASETNAVSASNAATAATNIVKWVSGTTYASGAVVWSPINGLGYRRITASGSGTTDPSADTTNYKQINGTGDVSTSGDQTIGGTKTFASVSTSKLVINGVDLSNDTGNFRNRVINGKMDVNQISSNLAGASPGAIVPNGKTYYIDRFFVQSSVTAKLFAGWNANTATAPSGLVNSFGASTRIVTTIGVSDDYSINQAIEGLNIYDLAWGTADAQTTTLTFWVRSSLTGNFGGAVSNAITGATRSYPFSYTITSANTWEKKVIIIPGDTSGTWNNNNSVGVCIHWGLAVGSTLSGTAGAWAAGDYRSSVGSNSILTTSGATFNITGVQFEKGPVSTAFENRNYSTELFLCRRYFQKASGDVIFSGNVTSGSIYYAVSRYFNSMRTSPTVTFTNVSLTSFAAATSVVQLSTESFTLLRTANATGVGLFIDTWQADAEL